MGDLSLALLTLFAFPVVLVVVGAWALFVFRVAEMIYDTVIAPRWRAWRGE